jgi:16S rRNA processing protein RimM
VIDSKRESVEWEALVAVGRVARAQGRHGEVAVDSWTSAPERFTGLSRVYVEAPLEPMKDSQPVALVVEGLRIHKGRPVLKLSGVSDISAAETLRGRELRVPESELQPLPAGSFYQFQVRGMTVTDRTRGEIGIVENVLETGGTDLLVVRGTGGEETLVPLCGEIVKNIDPVRGSVEIDAPEGLVSLNAN